MGMARRYLLVLLQKTRAIEWEAEPQSQLDDIDDPRAYQHCDELARGHRVHDGPSRRG